MGMEWDGKVLMVWVCLAVKSCSCFMFYVGVCAFWE